MDPFVHRWTKLSRERGPLCVGIGLTDQVLERWQMSPSLDAIALLGKSVLDAAAGSVALFEVHTGFYERFGGAGLDLLTEFVAGAHRSRSMVVLDAKRGGPADTNLALGELYLGPESLIRADGLVVHPYLGFTALQPVFDLAAERGSCVFVIARTSNDGGAEIQGARLADGRTVSEFVVDGVAQINHRMGGIAKPAGLVVGAGRDEAVALARRSDQALCFFPGLGRPGRSVEEFREVATQVPGRAILPITSAVLRHGPAVDGIATAIDYWRAQLRDF